MYLKYFLKYLYLKDLNEITNANICFQNSCILQEFIIFDAVYLI